MPPTPAPRAMPELDWQLLRFTELSNDALYAVLRLRQLIFVVEQNCAYLDADGRDADAWHLLGWQQGCAERSTLLAYARILRPGSAYAEASIGRVVTHSQLRGSGVGHELMRRALAGAAQLFGNGPIRIGAQAYLIDFYQRHGFAVIGPHYDEDGIPHVPMLRPIV